jgi:hypothetical protein
MMPDFTRPKIGNFSGLSIRSKSDNLFSHHAIFMSLTPGEIIKAKQILKVPAARLVELNGFLVDLVDPDAIANVRDIFIKWDELKRSDSPDRAGMTEAHVIKWDACDRAWHLSNLERRIQQDIAIAIGFQLDPEEVLAF